MKFLPRLLFRPTFLTGLSRHSAAHCPRTIDHLSGGEPVGNLRDSDPCLLALLCTRHKDDETVDLCDAVSTPAYLRDGDVVLLADFDWLWPKGPESAGTSVEVASSETRLFSHPSGSSGPLEIACLNSLLKIWRGGVFLQALGRQPRPQQLLLVKLLFCGWFNKKRGNFYF